MSEEEEPEEEKNWEKAEKRISNGKKEGRRFVSHDELKKLHF